MIQDELNNLYLNRQSSELEPLFCRTQKGFLSLLADGRGRAFLDYMEFFLIVLALSRELFWHSSRAVLLVASNS